MVDRRPHYKHRTQQEPPRRSDMSDRELLMKRFAITESELRDSRIANLLKEKISIDAEIRELRRDENFFTDERIARGLAEFGLTTADFKNAHVVELLKANLHGLAMLAGLRTSVGPEPKIGQTNA